MPDCRCLEQRRERQLHPEDLLDARHQPHRQQRVAAQREEVVGRPDPFETEKLGPDPGKDFFGLRPRRHIALLGALRLGRQQGLAVHLATGREWQRGKGHEGGGHHVVQQPFAQEMAQLFNHDIASHIGDQLPVAGPVFPRHHDRLADSGQRHQDRFDLAELDAKPRTFTW